MAPLRHGMCPAQMEIAASAGLRADSSSVMAGNGILPRSLEASSRSAVFYGNSNFLRKIVLPECIETMGEASAAVGNVCATGLKSEQYLECTQTPGTGPTVAFDGNCQKNLVPMKKASRPPLWC